MTVAKYSITLIRKNLLPSSNYYKPCTRNMVPSAFPRPSDHKKLRLLCSQLLGNKRKAIMLGMIAFLLFPINHFLLSKLPFCRIVAICSFKTVHKFESLDLFDTHPDARFAEKEMKNQGNIY
ncbi:hypothetical protein ILYODFUR_017559 [Ilyodon furcidens]|uniref:Transmembrane protein n=1 Tax=Ilyodon furcidens TaxID=33524 RepID=A0ABV0VES2_9TELE